MNTPDVLEWWNVAVGPPWPPQTAAVLRRARARVQRGWTQRPLAEDVRGRLVMPDDPAAVRWGISHAVAAETRTMQEGFPAITAMAMALGVRPLYGEVSLWERDALRTLGEVLELFDRAIALVTTAPSVAA